MVFVIAPEVIVPAPMVELESALKVAAVTVVAPRLIAPAESVAFEPEDVSVSDDIAVELDEVIAPRVVVD